MGKGPLTSEQVAFFKDAGFLLLKDVIDPRLCERAIDRLWRTLPLGSRMQREDPATHFGPFPADEESDDPLHIRRGYLWQLRECGAEPLLIELAYNAKMRAVAEQLLGKGMVAAPTVNGRPMGSTGTAWPSGPRHHRRDSRHLLHTSLGGRNQPSRTPRPA